MSVELNQIKWPLVMLLHALDPFCDMGDCFSSFKFLYNICYFTILFSKVFLILANVFDVHIIVK